MMNSVFWYQGERELFQYVPWCVMSTLTDKLKHTYQSPQSGSKFRIINIIVFLIYISCNKVAALNNVHNCCPVT